MTVTTFAAIDIGSYEVCMKIFELSRKKRISRAEPCKISSGNRKRRIFFRASGTGNGGRYLRKAERFPKYDAGVWRNGISRLFHKCFREMVNPVIILEQIYQRTGIRVEILSNAEQHFLGYKSIAAIESGFKKIIQKGTAILDVGGGGLQVSLFDKDTLVTTQSLKNGKYAY